MRIHRLAIIAEFVAVAAFGLVNGASAASLALVGSITIGPAAGKITDLELDYASQRLFALEPEQGAIAVIDLPTRTVTQTLTQLRSPQGMAHEPPNGQLYVALAGGKLGAFQGAPLRQTGTLMMGSNLGRPYYDASSTRVFLGIDHRAIGVVDTARNKALPDIGLDGDPGSIAFEALGTRLFAGAVGEKRVLVVDRAVGKQIASWKTGGEAAALALDEEAGFLIVALRQPAGFAWFDLLTGVPRGRIEACAEPGSLIVDSGRARVYLACGEGRIDVYQRGAGGTYAKTGSLDTEPGATAALLAPIGDRLYLAVPAGNGRSAEIRIYAPGK